MSKTLLDRPLETKGSPLWSANKPVCFRNLLVGTKALGMSYPSERSWAPFIAEIKAHFGVKSKPKLRQQRITIFMKHGRRTFTNYEELAEHLKRRFDVQVDIWEPALYSMQEQVKYLERSTVIVSPCGGMSFGSMFLPPGASAVFAE
jgi:hypothetical protein